MTLVEADGREEEKREEKNTDSRHCCVGPSIYLKLASDPDTLMFIDQQSLRMVF